MLDLVIAFCHIVSYSLDVRELSTSDRGRANEHCEVISFFYQVALFGSNGWYFILSIDLFLAIRHPFR